MDLGLHAMSCGNWPNAPGLTFTLWCCSVWLGSFLWGPMLNLTSWQGQLLKVPLQCLPGLGDLLVATGWTWHESHLFAIPVSPCLGSLLVLLVLRTEL